LIDWFISSPFSPVFKKANIWQNLIFSKIQYLAKANIRQKPMPMPMAMTMTMKMTNTNTMEKTVTRVEHNRILASWFISSPFFAF
jgi:hypothetical protein